MKSIKIIYKIIDKINKRNIIKISIRILVILIILLSNNIIFKYEHKKKVLLKTKIISFNYSNLYIKIIDFKYNFSFKYKITKIIFNFGIFDNNNKIIPPSNFSLYNDMNFICNINVKNINISIDSLPSISQNRYYTCIEFFYIGEIINYGLKLFTIYKNNEFYNLFIFSYEKINYNNMKYKSNILFDPLLNKKIYISLFNKQKTFTLKKYYMKYPYFLLKRNFSINESEWAYKNIYNNIFCFFKGKNYSIRNITQKCKYFFYISIIDNNRDVYSKTNYLFADFLFSKFSPDDTFPVFEKMDEKGLPSHYITERKDIYIKYCENTKNCLKIIQINDNNYKKIGDFLEKYLYLLLKLKAVISAKGNNYPISKLFYKLEYLTYIAIGHGLCYFKDYLYADNRLYGRKVNNKILIPPSNKVIIIAKKFGWKDEDIIKLNLPRWEKFINNNQTTKNTNLKHQIKNNSILIMFTWRDIRKNQSISLYYIKNIIKLITNNILITEIKKKNITIYFSVHRFLYTNKNIFKNIIKKNENIVFINQNEISYCLCIIDLVISDFSSIIFDLMFRNKPFILFIPDSYDYLIKKKYTKDYYQLINSLLNDTIKFKNKFFSINKAVKKILYYIKNNFTLEPELKKFYKSFGLKHESHIEKFINYLIKLK